jgi:tetratricopeptide (TPR) repeat protein
MIPSPPRRRRSRAWLLIRHHARRSSRHAARWIWEHVRKEITPLRILLAFLFIPIAWYVYTEAVRDVIVVESVSVPKAYEERGFTSAVMTLRIAERLQQLEQSLETHSQRDRLMQSGNSDVPNIEVPATKLSLQTLVQFTQQTLHHEPEHIRGEITWPWSEALNGDRKEGAVLWYHIYQGQQLRWADRENIGTRDPDEVVQQYAEGLLKRLNPYLWAVYLLDNKHDVKAAKWVAQSIITSSTNRNAVAKAYNLLGNIDTNEGKRDEAIQKYRKAIEADPKFAMAYISWGVVLDKQGKRQEAIEKYRKATELDPKYASPYINWGVVLDKQGKRQEAIEKYRKATELDPKYASPYINWGVVLNEEGKRQEAIEKYRKATELDPKLASAYFDWGAVLAEEGKREEAIEKYRKATELDPKLASAYFNWGAVLAEEGKREEAEEKFQKAAELSRK